MEERMRIGIIGMPELIVIVVFAGATLILGR
jgi:hypothetical protein